MSHWFSGQEDETTKAMTYDELRKGVVEQMEMANQAQSMVTTFEEAIRMRDEQFKAIKLTTNS